MAYQIKISGTDVVFSAEKGERLLDAAARAGLNFPHACRCGFCGMCAATVVSGDFIAYAPGSAEGRPSKGPRILTCSTEAASDAEISIQFTRLSPNVRMRVASMERLAPDVIRLVLQPVSGEPFSYLPGQFVDFILEGGERRSYSIAAAHAKAGLELHIRHVPGGLFTDRLFGVKGDPVAKGTEFEVAAPSGEFRIDRESGHDIVFLMTGTGFAPAKAMIESLISRPLEGKAVYLYWGGRHRVDLYMDELCRSWDAKYEWFHYCPVLSRATPEEAWDGRTGHVQNAFVADHPDASGFDAYICGSMRLVEDSVRALTAAGMKEENIRSDAFTSKAGLN